MRRYRVLPYRTGSKGAKALAEALGGKVLKLEGSGFKPTLQDVIVNWGNTSSPLTEDYCLNAPAKIRTASNKRLFFERMAGAAGDITPRFWITRQDIPEDAFPVVCRTVLAGHSGEGIVIAATPAELVPAPLYVEYVKKQDEYRIHVGLNSRFVLGDAMLDAAKIISVQQKRRRTDHENPNWQIRNHANGFIYARADVNPPDDVINKAKQALLASGLEFGAVDVIYNQQQSRAYVLEINTAPGLEGQTVADYAAYFKGI